MKLDPLRGIGMTLRWSLVSQASSVLNRQPIVSTLYNLTHLTYHVYFILFSDLVWFDVWYSSFDGCFIQISIFLHYFSIYSPGFLLFFKYLPNLLRTDHFVNVCIQSSLFAFLFPVLVFILIFKIFN